VPSRKSKPDRAEFAGAAQESDRKGRASRIPRAIGKGNNTSSQHLVCTASTFEIGPGLHARSGRVPCFINVSE
jgi:hypothetical protein